MNKQMELLNIMKLNTSYIVKHNSDVYLTYEDAISHRLIVSLGDNQLFRFIRQITHNENLFAEINEIKQQIKVMQKQPSKKDTILAVARLRQQLVLKQFVPDIVSVRSDLSKKYYKEICKNKFKITISVYGITYSITYRRLCAGAGQLRRNSAIFCNEEIYDTLHDVVMCGLDKKRIGRINLAKFSAYFALFTSSAREVTMPRICIIPDYEYVLKDQSVDWIYDNSDGEKDITEKKIDFDVNAFDGSGMISPAMAQKWQEDLQLSYLPSSFIVRSAWIKGLVSVFDFHKFAKEIAHKDYITDYWGNTYPIDEIDVILTTSQMKMYKYYKNMQEYLYYHNLYGHVFSITRVNKAQDNLLTTLNYQYIQTNSFTKDMIHSIADYSINWARKIMERDYLYTILFLNGTQSQIRLEEIDTLEDNLLKALMYCPNLMNDRYLNHKMIRLIQSKVDGMKIGKIWVEGSYQFMIPDLFAMAEHAFGMPVKGLLKAGELWNKHWAETNTEKVVCMRSPLVAPSENRLMNIYNDDMCQEWFKYIKSGHIFNIHDMTVIAMSDADYDGDLCLSTNNPILIKAAGDNKKVITYEKKKAKTQYLNDSAFAVMDTKSFNGKIGVITNIASNMISLQSVYEPDSKEYQELDRRIKLLRYFQGSKLAPLCSNV